MFSMTGFGSTTVKSKKYAFNVTVKSINSRYLDLRFHLPDSLQSLEPELRKIINNTIKRGTVTVVIDAKALSTETDIIDIDRAEKIYKQAKLLGKKLKLNDTVTLDTLLRMPELMIASDTAFDETDKKAALKAVEAALELCNREREREGKSTSAMFKSLFSNLKTNAEHILKKAHPSEAELTQKLIERLEKLGLRGEVDSNRLAQEVVIQLEKADVTEETERILEHLKGMQGTLLSGDPVGKKLEFYTQELFREFNTIGSKSQDAEVTKVVIESKVIIDRLREQVQNIE